jgi:hypothetical protein
MRISASRREVLHRTTYAVGFSGPLQIVVRNLNAFDTLATKITNTSGNSIHKRPYESKIDPVSDTWVR